MIHIVIAHVGADTWLKLQMPFFKKTMGDAEYRIYTAVTYNTDYWKEKLHYVVDGVDFYDPRAEQQRLEGFSQIQANALNALCKVACDQAESPSDLLVVIDGDALPVGDFGSSLHKLVSDYPLAAACRTEDLGDWYSHPSFCVTTVDFWKRLPGTWSIAQTCGRPWGDAVNRLNDVGGALNDRLRKKHIQWKPIFRSNKRNLHPVWYGLYGDIMYHHGAGFRPESIHFNSCEIITKLQSHRLYNNILHSDPDVAMSRTDEMVKTVFDDLAALNMRTSAEVMDWIAEDPEFYTWFQGKQHQTPVKDRWCDHKHRRLVPDYQTNWVYVECIECFARGGSRRTADEAIANFEELDEDCALHVMDGRDWFGYFNRAEEYDTHSNFAPS